MNPQDTTPHSSRSPWKRRIVRGLGAMLGGMLVLILGKDVWVTWGVNAALWATHQDGHVERVQWDVWEGQITLLQLQWQDQEKGMSLHTDTLQLTNLTWSQDSLRIGRVELGQLRLASQALRSFEDTLPSPAWTDIWPSSLACLFAEELQWNGIHLDADSVSSVVLQQGRMAGLDLSLAGITLPTFEVSGAYAMSPNLPDKVVLRASHAGGTWTPSGWHVQSRGLNLPGIRFVGDLAWPALSGHGDLELQWDELQPWADLLGQGERLAAWDLAGTSSLASWDVDSSRWQAHVTGPEWLKVTGMGSPSSWALELGLTRLPLSVQKALSVSELKLQARGNASMTNWNLEGGSRLSLEGNLESGGALMEVVTGMTESWTASVELNRWPTWVESNSERVQAHVQVKGEVWNIVAQQDSAEVPWRAQAQWQDSTVNLRAWIPQLPQSSEITSPLEAWGRVRTNSAFSSVTWSLAAALENDTLRTSGRLNLAGDLPSWSASLTGAGVHASLQGRDSPSAWSRALSQAANREPTTWPSLHAEVAFAPENVFARHVLPSVTFKDSAFVTVHSDAKGIQGQASLRRWNVGEMELDSTHVTIQGLRSTLYANISIETPESRPLGMPSMVSLDIHADTSWFANLAADMGQGVVAEWAVEGTPGNTARDHWTWVAHQGDIPLGFDRLILAETPFTWTAPLSAPLPSFWKLRGQRGELTFQSQRLAPYGQSLSFRGRFARLEDLVRSLDPNLALDDVALNGTVEWRGEPSDLSAWVDFNVMGFQYDRIHLPEFQASAKWQNGLIYSTLSAYSPKEQCSLESEGVILLARQVTPRLEVEANHVPLTWFQSWVDSSAALVQGHLDVSLQALGLLAAPQIQGTGKLTDVQAYVPSLGTSFGGSGGLVVEPDGIYLDAFVLSDAKGTTTRVEGALFHDAYHDWNLNVGITDAQENLLIMDLPTSPGAPVFGTLHGRGAVDVTYWNDDILIEGDVVADAPTQFHISLVTESDDGWDELVHFKRLNVTQTATKVATPDLGVTLDLKIQALPAAEVTVVMDEENNANIVGHTEGNIHFVLEDWERMTLNGELRVVEGQYDFALGQFLRKEFVSREGGTLFWNGDPYAGTLELDAVYTTRANVQPLIGTNSSGGSRNESIDVVLHLNGPMLKPNISFDLEAPKADRLVAEAISSALVDENDRTNQAIALLSLQEFLPTDFNTLQLGANGLQEYSIDMVTSQLSRWLSRINEDVEVGISYDATSDVNPDLSDNQDALQLALKASFLKDKLEVEGSLGSSAITQEALGEARLQNIRVNYHLNEAKGLDLTGYSESQTSATQSANSTSQGVGIRWHRSFDWKWPKRQKDADD